MHEWIRDLAAFVQHDKTYVYGTRSAGDYKVLTSRGTIEVQEDKRWRELLSLMEIFAG